MLLLWSQPSGAVGAPLNLNSCVGDVVFRLGFANAGQMEESDWINGSELLKYGYEAAQRLAAKAGVFLTFASDTNVTAGEAIYNLPARHVYTVLAALNGAVLRITPVAELWALDGNWPTTPGTPKRVSLDAGAVGTATLYPVPESAGRLAEVFQQAPDEVTSLPLPSVFQDYFSYAMLSNARGKESDHRMEEVTQHCELRMKLYEQVAEHLWGPGK